MVLKEKLLSREVEYRQCFQVFICCKCCASACFNPAEMAWHSEINNTLKYIFIESYPFLAKMLYKFIQKVINWYLLNFLTYCKSLYFFKVSNHQSGHSLYTFLQYYSDRKR